MLAAASLTLLSIQVKVVDHLFILYLWNWAPRYAAIVSKTSNREKKEPFVLNVTD